VANVSQNPLYGRAWELSIDLTPDANGNGDTLVVSSDAWDPETLRIVFDVNLPAYKAVWFAKIEIYNLNGPTAQQILDQGMNITLKAGYQDQPYGIIFKGQIYQPLFDRSDNVVDQKLTLMCYTGLPEAIGNFASFRGSAYSTQLALIQKMAASANTPITVGSLDSTALQGAALPYPRAFFGDPNKYFDRVARANNLQSWYGFDGLNLGDVQQQTPVATITYTPTTGILGTPQQTQDGVEMRVLMDARLQITQPPMQVKIDNSIIRQMPIIPGNYRSVLDQDGLYIVMGLNHRGDSRSLTEWYTEIVGCTSVGGKLALLASASDGSVQLDRRSPQGSGGGQ
jgi:hypothetical protein